MLKRKFLSFFPRVFRTSSFSTNTGRQAGYGNYDFSAEIPLHDPDFGIRSQEKVGYIDGRLYEGHVTLSWVQKAVLGLGSAGVLLFDPSRDDLVATLGEVTAGPVLDNIRLQMEADPIGRQILSEKQRINSKTIDIEALGRLPNNTLGFAYREMLMTQGITPDSRKEVIFLGERRNKYIMQRYREVHDFFHLILGLPTHLLGESCVKIVEFLQLGLPMAGLASIAGPLRLGPKHRALFFEHFLPWAIRVGLTARPLILCYYEREFETPLEELRERFGIPPLPIDVPRKKQNIDNNIS